ncbi:MAG: outer membrane lipoprotein carrier protein LolA [Gammaproteobacteria bacterium HGW-Gammaproteobacteria-6]|nr:MAG: outer membrane lipoprotein carrier protein LolA [Gammaproteobacteria bacterium HGW-Gammaproteobacteria-6]
MLKTLLLPGLAALLLSLPVQAQTDDQAVAAERLNGLLSSANTITAAFSQMTLSSNGANMQEATGQMELKRPGMFYWHTDAPLEQVVVTDGEKMWLYDPDLMQVIVQDMDMRLTHTPALLLSGDVSTLQESFNITVNEGGDVVDFVLTPKVNDTLFDTLRVSFWGGVINDMQISDGVGQRTNILFSNVQINEPIDDQRFVFVAPEGVDVISD